jgi:hypothetical protein
MNVTSQSDDFVQACIGQSGSLHRLRFDNPKKGEAAVVLRAALLFFGRMQTRGERRRPRHRSP